MNWKTTFEQEVANAKKARLEGNEARARVCARRAANVIVQEYLRSLGLQPFRSSIQNFRWLQAHLEKGHPAQELLSHLLQKVDFDFTFPADIDLIEDAHALKESLLSEASSQDLMHTRSTDEFPASDNHH